MKIQITAVNYLNTLPFKYGIEHTPAIHEWAEINYASPAECAKMLITNKTNIALAPVAILGNHPHLNIITDYCLSTNDAVQSVKLYAHKSIREIKNIVLDYQSLSSVSLLKVLMKFYWNKEVEYLHGYYGFENELKADAMVVIGDRTFELNGKFEYEYDLATEWFRFFGKPFVFAAWISNVHLNDKQLNDLNTAFECSINNIDAVIDDSIKNTNILNFLNTSERKKVITNYLKNNMQYNFNNERKQSLEHFLKLLKSIFQENIYAN